MSINWKDLNSPEHKRKTMRKMGVKAAELILEEVPSSRNPYYDYGSILENLQVIEELNIEDTKVAEYLNMQPGTSVTAKDIKYVTDKLKEAKALVYNES